MGADPNELRMAQESLYEDESLRRNLTDDQATPLLDWASDRLEKGGDAPLETVQEKVRAVLKLVNQAAAKDGDERNKLVGNLPALLDEVPGDGPPPPLPRDFGPIAAQMGSAKGNTVARATAPAEQPSEPASAPVAATPAAPVADATPTAAEQPTTTAAPAAPVAEATPAAAEQPTTESPAVPQAAPDPASNATAPANASATPYNLLTLPKAPAPAPAPAQQRTHRSRRVRWGYRAGRGKRPANEHQKEATT